MSNDELGKALSAFDESLHDLIEELLMEYFTGEERDISVAAMGVRKRRLERKRDSLKDRKTAIRENINDTEAELEIIENVSRELNSDGLIEDAIEILSTLNEERRDPSNPAVEKHAKRVGLTPQQLLERLNEEYPTDQLGQPITD